MQPGILAALVVVPGVRHILLDLVGIIHIDFVNGRQVPVQNGAGRNQETGRIIHALFRKVAEGEEITQPFTTRTPVLVETGDRQQIRDIHLVNKRLHLVDDFLHLRQLLGIDGRIGIQVDRTGDTAHQEIRVRILATKDGVQLGHITLPGQCFKVMRHRHQVSFRWQLVGRVAPVTIGKDAQLAALDKILQLLLHVGEIAG